MRRRIGCPTRRVYVWGCSRPHTNFAGDAALDVSMAFVRAPLRGCPRCRFCTWGGLASPKVVIPRSAATRDLSALCVLRALCVDSAPPFPRFSQRFLPLLWRVAGRGRWDIPSTGTRKESLRCFVLSVPSVLIVPRLFPAFLSVSSGSSAPLCGLCALCVDSAAPFPCLSQRSPWLLRASAQPSKRPMLLRGEDRQWYHPRMRNSKCKTSRKAAPPTC
jgi:hypothetical protein